MEINRPKEKNIVVGGVYRPPNQNLQDFMNSLDSLLASISKENKICYVLGDWNLDLINHHCHDSTGELLETMYSRVFFPLITRPTTLGTRGFPRVQREFSVLAEGRHIFGRRPNSRATKPREKPLARSGAFYRPR